MLAKLVEAVIARDADKALAQVGEAFKSGTDPALFLREFVLLWRELLVAKTGGASALARIGLGKDEASELLEKVVEATPRDIQDLTEIAREGADNAIRSSYPQYAIEALVVRMASREPVREVMQLVESLQGVLAHGGAIGGPSMAPSRTEPAPRTVPVAGTDAPSAKAPAHEASKGTLRSPEARANISWQEFVAGIKGISNSMVLEQLKRLSVQEFGGGQLKASGPEFTIGYLTQAGNREKLEGLLAQATGVSSWKITLLPALASQGEPVAGSILHGERRDALASRKEKEKDISTHPKMKSLQKAFPGSVIENIRIKE